MTLPFHQVCRISPFPTFRRVFAQPLNKGLFHSLRATRYSLQLRQPLATSSRRSRAARRRIALSPQSSVLSHPSSTLSPQPLHHAVAAQRGGGSPLHVYHSTISAPLSVLSTFALSHFLLFSPCHPNHVLQSSTTFFTRYNRRDFQGIFLI